MSTVLFKAVFLFHKHLLHVCLSVSVFLRKENSSFEGQSVAWSPPTPPIHPSHHHVVWIQYMCWEGILYCWQWFVYRTGMLNLMVIYWSRLWGNPGFHLLPAISRHLKFPVSLNYSTADEEHSVFVRKLHLLYIFCFIFTFYDAHLRARWHQSSVLGKCRYVPLSIYIGRW